MSVADVFGCAMTNCCFARVEMYTLPAACALAAFAVSGQRPKNEFAPARWSATVVLVALAVSVTVPVQASLPMWIWDAHTWTASMPFGQSGRLTSAVADAAV